MRAGLNYDVLMSNILETYRVLKRNSHKVLLLLRYYVSKVAESGKGRWVNLCNPYILMAALALHLNGIVITVDNVRWVLERIGVVYSRGSVSSSLKSLAVLKIIRSLKVKRNFRMYVVEPEFESLLIRELKL